MSTCIYTLAVSQVLDMLSWVSTIFKQRTEMSLEYHILWDAELDIQQIQPPITIPLDKVEEMLPICLDCNTLPHEELCYSVTITPDSCIQLISSFADLRSENIRDIIRKCSVSQPMLVSDSFFPAGVRGLLFGYVTPWVTLSNTKPFYL